MNIHRSARTTFASRVLLIERVRKQGWSIDVSKVFAAACKQLHQRTRPYTPRTNGKAERFIQTLLREWAYVQPYQHSRLRRAALRSYLCYYNERRPHGSLQSLPPVSRIARAA